MFEYGVRPPEVARRLRVSRKSAYAWRDGGKLGLASKGPGGIPCQLNDAQAERWQADLEAGPAAHGWSEDQRWTLARVAELIRRLFGHRYTPRGVSYLLHRLVWSPQVPAHRAVERDEQAVESLHAHPPQEFPAHTLDGCAPPPAQIHQVRAGAASRGCPTPVPRVLLSVPLAEPAPSGSTDTSRRCQGCSHPPRHHPDQAALSSTLPLRRDQR